MADHTDTVRVARFDKTQNDFSVRGIKITHYPTVLLFPATELKTPLDFDDFNGSKVPHSKFVPHTHYSVELLSNFVLNHLHGLSEEEQAVEVARAKEVAEHGSHQGHEGHNHN